MSIPPIDWMRASATSADMTAIAAPAFASATKLGRSGPLLAASRMPAPARTARAASRHFQGATVALQIRLSQMTYLMRGSFEATMELAICSALHPCFGSLVMSLAVTTPIVPSVTQGL